MNNDSIYTLTETADSIVPSGVETMSDWFESLSEKDFNNLYRMCVKRPEDRSGQEDYEICRHSIVLYCRELGLSELGINSEFMNKITGSFCLNVISEALRREGMVEVDGPFMLYKNNDIKLSDNYKPDK